MYITPKLDWNATNYHNFADKNRVENNTDYINTLLATFDTPATLTPIVTTRDNTYIDFQEDFNRIETNINAVKNAFAEPNGWNTLSANWQEAITPFSFIDANAWENNIDKLKNSMTGTIDYFMPCGTFKCGNDRIRQHFTRS